MKNKQLDTKDLLMNKKEELIWRVIDNVINCCAVTRIDGAKSITREDVVGKSREENVVLTRCLVVEQMVHAGFTISTIAFILNRNRNPYDDEERYHEREEYGHRERGRYGRY